MDNLVFEEIVTTETDGKMHAFGSAPPQDSRRGRVPPSQRVK